MFLTLLGDTLQLSDEDMSDVEILSGTLAIEKKYGQTVDTAIVIEDNSPGASEDNPIIL